jgi:hypothetical protein
VTTIVILGTVLYVRQEKYVYYWDFSHFHDRTIDLAMHFRNLSFRTPHDWIRIFREYRDSTGRPYSNFHTILASPVVLLFGPSRETYILTLTVIYLLPFVLMIGAISKELVHRSSIALMWLTVVIALAVPAIWIPTLQGYPDIGATALITLAMLVYLRDPNLRSPWQVGVIGMAVALAILFRRHYGYGVIALYLAMIIQVSGAFISAVRTNRAVAVRQFASVSSRIAATAAVGVITVILLGWPFIDMVMRTDFTANYASYQVLPSDVWPYYRNHYGWAILGMAFAGFVIGSLTRTLKISAAWFMFLVGAISAGLWFFVVRQRGDQYTLHFAPTIICGLAAFVWTVWTLIGGWRRCVVVASALVLLGLNVLGSLTPADAFGIRGRMSDAWLSLSSGPLANGNLFAVGYPPMQRDDLPELARLVQELRALASVGDPIYVAASSDVLNDSILLHADRVLKESKQEPWWISASKPGLNVLTVPQIDSRDSYPLPELLKAKYVVVADPFQHHIPIGEQDVVKVVVDAFFDDWRVAKDFVRLPTTYSLENGVDVYVFERKRDTLLGTAVTTLRAMQAQIDLMPRGQKDWIGLDAAADSSIGKDENGGYTIAVDPTGYDASFERRFLYLNTTRDAMVVTGAIDYQMQGCEQGEQLTLTIDTINDRGDITRTSSRVMVPLGKSRFSLSLGAPATDLLLLTISSGSGGLGERNVVVTDLEVAAEVPRTSVRARLGETPGTALEPIAGTIPTTEPTVSTPTVGHLVLRSETTDGFLDAVCGVPVNGPDQAPMEVPAGGAIQVEGWAVDKPAGGLAGGVLIMVDEQIPIQAEYGQERTDVAEALGNAAYLNSGYTAIIPAEFLPPGRHTLTVRVLSQDGQSYYPSTEWTKAVVRVRDRADR